MKVLVDPDYSKLQFTKRLRSRFFVDKTMLLGTIIDQLSDDECFACVTRPRRFGKSMAASMIAAFFGPKDSSRIFNTLAISTHPQYREFLNSAHVIYLDLTPDDEITGVDGLLSKLKTELVFALSENFPDVPVPNLEDAILYLSRICTKTDAQFVFVIDEWDAILHRDETTIEQRKKYLSFLTTLLKGQEYVAYAYLTGILPIVKHSPGCDLNMFDDYTFINDQTFDSFFGFTEPEVNRLFAVYLESCAAPEISRDELDLWYNGYTTANGVRLYNPHSTVKALSKNKLDEYWGDSGPNNEVLTLVRANVDTVLTDIKALLLGETVSAKVKAKLATEPVMETREEILSALVVYGLLTQSLGNDREQQVLRIPNEEIRRKFIDNISKHKAFGELYKIDENGNWSPAFLVTKTRKK